MSQDNALDVDPDRSLAIAAFAACGSLTCVGCSHASGTSPRLPDRPVHLNTNVGNVVAAIFAATGQDLASVHESAVAVMAVGAQPNGDLNLSLTIPSLVIGTVGGGTHLQDQREGLELMACRGTGSVKKLGEVIAGVALALDLSTMSAIVAGPFAIAHEKTGRNNHEGHFKLRHLRRTHPGVHGRRISRSPAGSAHGKPAFAGRLSALGRPGRPSPGPSNASIPGALSHRTSLAVSAAGSRRRRVPFAGRLEGAGGRIHLPAVLPGS